MIDPVVARHDTEGTGAGSRALLVVLILGILYVARHLSRGWVPFDEGAMAQAAERVLHGQLPHRDFDDIYTGGLALWDALAFRVFGITLLSMRLALFAVFILWIPAVYYLASRVSGPVRAAFITFLAVVWSLPNYNAAMPSWYNLFFATFALAALSRSIETGRARWLCVAGVATGLSLLVKIVGIYLIAGALLFFVFEEQLAAEPGPGAPVPEGREKRSYSLFVTGALALFIAMLGVLVSRRAYAPEIVHFFLPGAVLAGFLIQREWTATSGPDGPRWVRLSRMIAPFLLGLAIPIALFLVPYVRSDSVPALLTGVFVLPARRFDVATMRLPGLLTMLAVIPALVLVWAARRMRRATRWYESAGLAVVVIAFVYATGSDASLYRSVWNSARSAFPLLVCAGVWALSRPREIDRARPDVRRWTFLLLAGTTMCSLVQYPFAAPSYFTYVAPLVILTALMLFQYVGPVVPRVLPRLLVAVYMLFAMFRMNISLLTRMGASHVPYFRTVPLSLERGGLRVSRGEAEIYGNLIPALRAHARGGYTWAAPDLPEVYFLSGLENPTRSLFDFLNSKEMRTDDLLRLFDERAITAVVLNLNTYYSRSPSPDLVRAVETRFPYSRDFGPLQLRWRS